MKINIKSKKGFTLIELLVVIGILAVLAAIAIPSVAGLIDRANVSADKTNSNEMTNAIERFASEYELYCQDIASGIITPSTTDLDSAQNRVYNVVQTKTRDGIASLEVDADTIVTDPQIAIYRDTKYPANTTTLKAIVENYTKTSSATFDPKQSDMHYWYSPACGTVVVSTPESSIAEKNALIVSGTDAKGRQLDDVNEFWIDLTINTALVGKDITNSEIIPLGGTYITASGTTLVAGEEFPSISNGDIYRYGNYEYRYNQYYGSGNWINNTSQGWGVLCLKNVAYPGEVLGTINGKNLTHFTFVFSNCDKLTTAPIIPNTVRDVSAAFSGCSSLVTYTGSTDEYGNFSNYILPNKTKSINSTFQNCTKLTFAPQIPSTVTNVRYAFVNCTSLIVAPDVPDTIEDLTSTYYGCSSITVAPKIPSNAKYMYCTFYKCTSLTEVGELPNGLIDARLTFKGCKNLVTAPTIPSSVQNMQELFSLCSKLSGTVRVDTNPETYENCFYGVQGNVVLVGDSTLLNELAETGTYNNITVG